MLKSTFLTQLEYDIYLNEQKIRKEKGYLTVSERKQLDELIKNPKNYIKEELKKLGRPIITDINQLRIPCQEVVKGDNIKEIIQDLKNTLNENDGGAIGLAANQIGYNKRISYIKIPKINSQTKKIEYTELVLINPRIIERERKVLVSNEGCLSLPGLRINTDRYVFITVVYQDEKLKQNTAMFQDLESISVQHEIDHLNGSIIIDRKHRK